LLYFPWALLQQFVFQFYLLGRLSYLLPPAVAIGITAVAFSAVHYPRYPIMAGTLIGCLVWSLSYRRHRVLLPLAASHALLGATMHYWVIGRDLLADL
jgi:membrane protease YdiL (CAAX protease family)